MTELQSAKKSRVLDLKAMALLMNETIIMI